MRPWTAPLLSLFCAALLAAADPPKIPVGPALQSISVNICCPTSGYGERGTTQGSGTLVVGKVGDKPAVWVLTAHHVVSSLRTVQDVISSTGEPKKQVRYRDAQIIQERVVDGRGVGERTFDALVISVDPRRDIALLRVRDGEFTKQGVQFYTGSEICQPGVELYHCGAPGGKEIGGTCSLTAGIISRIGVRIPEFGGAEHGIFDQVDCPARGGSSGGLIALRESGQWIGMITLGLGGGDSFHWAVPIRSVRAWTRDLKIEWLLDPTKPAPSEEEVSKIRLENDPVGFPGTPASQVTPKPTETPPEPRIQRMIRTEPVTFRDSPIPDGWR